MNLPRLLLTAAALGGLAATAALAQSTAFTYQGRLDAGGQPANGLFSLKFSLHNAAAGGAVVGVPLTNAPVGVTNGLFAVTLDFGLTPFDGSDRWLEIAVRPNGVTNAHTALSPRQAVTATPYAIRATTAGTAATVTAGGITAGQLANGAVTFGKIAGNAVTSSNIVNGSIGLADLGPDVGVWAKSGTNISYSGGNVGIGTNAPNGQLQVSDGTQRGNMVLQALPGANSGYVSLGFNGYHNSGEFRINPAKARYRVLADQRASADHFAIDTYDTNNVGRVALAVTPNGNVGIGTVSPGAKLEVAGTVTLGGTISSEGTKNTFNGMIETRYGDNDRYGIGQFQNGVLGIYGSDYYGPSSIQFGLMGAGGNFMSQMTIAHNGNVTVGRELTCTAVNLTSDRNAKEDFKPVSGREVLAKVAALPITEWQYKTQGDARHIGPMAQDFHAAFGTGLDDKHIASVDADGVALAAIQGLNEKLEEKTREVEELKRSVSELHTLMDRLAR